MSSELPAPSLSQLNKRSKKLLGEAEALLARKGRKHLPLEVLSSLEAKLTTLTETQKTATRDNTKAFQLALMDAEGAVTEHLGQWRKSAIRESLESIVWALSLAFVIRCFFFEAFSIPSSSMYPTLEIGDHLFVNKIQLGVYKPFSAERAISWSEPKHGDIIVFIYRDPVPGQTGQKTADDIFGSDSQSSLDGQDFIKRVVAVPGDRIRLENNRLILNGQPIQTEEVSRTQCGLYAGADYNRTPAGYCPCVLQRETIGDASWITQHYLPGCGFKTAEGASWPQEVAPFRKNYFGAKADNPHWPDVLVPEGHVLVMGDNRDASEDGRFWGFVPYERIKGKAFVIFFPFSRIFTWIG